MKTLTHLFEALSASDIAKKLKLGAKTLEYVSTNMSNIEGELERWAGKGNVKLDYRIESENLYLDVTVKGKTKSENIARARDIALGYIALTHNTKSDTEFYVCWNL